MVLVFDLDDTLYAEIAFVRSGFRSVAEHLANIYDLDQNNLYSHMHLDLEQYGRGRRVFDSVLKQYNIYSRQNVKKCLAIYRQHHPRIQLEPDSYRCLNRFNKYSKYIVTDGNIVAQKNKVESLNLSIYFKKILYTHYFGIHNEKPSPYCFIKIAQLENIPNIEICYIGDNPNKDFVGIKPLGFITIRIRRGMFKDLTLDTEHEAHININSLDEITEDLLSSLQSSPK